MIMIGKKRTERTDDLVDVVSEAISNGAGRHSALIYGGVALGLLAGAAISAYWWKQHTRALNLLHATPLERAEELIASCEKKIEDIEHAIDELKVVSASAESQA
jgi:hypothetical protein